MKPIDEQYFSEYRKNKDYDSTKNEMKEFVLHAIKTWREKNTESKVVNVIDLGAADGCLLRYTSEQENLINCIVQVSGVEIFKDIINHPEVEHGDALNWLKSLKSNSADIIYATCLMYLSYKENVEILKECRRVIRQNGILLSVNRLNFYESNDKIKNYTWFTKGKIKDIEDPYLKCSLPKGQWVDMIENSGFDVIYNFPLNTDIFLSTTKNKKSVQKFEYEFCDGNFSKSKNSTVPVKKIISPILCRFTLFAEYTMKYEFNIYISPRYNDIIKEYYWQSSEPLPPVILRTLIKNINLGKFGPVRNFEFQVESNHGFYIPGAYVQEVQIDKKQKEIWIVNDKEY